MTDLLLIRGISRTPISIGNQRLSVSQAVTIDLDDPKTRKDLERYKGLWFVDVGEQLSTEDVDDVGITGDQNIAGIKTFVDGLRVSVDPDDDFGVINRGYFDANQSSGNTIQILEFVYDFDEHGGAQGVIVLGELPAGTILMNSGFRIVDPITTPTSDGAAVISVGWTDESNGIVPVAGFDTGQFDAGIAHEGITGQALRFPDVVEVLVGIQDADLTAGKFVVRLGILPGSE